MSIQHAFMPAAAILLTACAAAPQASAESDAPPRTITVTGEGEAAAAPDMAILSIGVQTEGDTAGAALRENSAAMAATIDKLKELGIADRDLQTSGLSINPRYDYERNRTSPLLIGYVAANRLTVKLRDLESAGNIIDQAVQAGANSLDGVSFTFSDPGPFQDQAREDAVAKAHAKAMLLTEAAGVRLGPVLTIHEGYAAPPSPQPGLMRMEAASADSVPFETGESVIHAGVTIVYEIAD
jgi:hypothetical protein